MQAKRRCVADRALVGQCKPPARRVQNGTGANRLSVDGDNLRALLAGDIVVLVEKDGLGPRRVHRKAVVLGEAVTGRHVKILGVLAKIDHADKDGRIVAVSVAVIQRVDKGGFAHEWTRRLKEARHPVRSGEGPPDQKDRGN